MSIDLSGLSAKELSSLIREAQKRKTVVAKRPPASAVRALVTKAAEKAGYTIPELFGHGVGGGQARGHGSKASKPAKKGAVVAPKYRDTGDAANTWTGRGKHPRWLAAHLAAGRKIEEFAIKE